ncbi:hypothetical protein RI543_000468 [Arxiozyma heterogenica]|uniref:Hyphally-regulated cell wall protein N-terminal domain-containing protein n=1 Tax=Arxiozyma heterogenica TaxID=278026 RepID=A0AAN8A843_9SACH|nr:hypothetical protein RI543_000468 [Kazachstania heterogenica]
MNKFLLTFADAITISTYTYLNNNDLSNDITINQDYFLALVNGNTEDFQHNLVVKGSLFIGDKNPADSGFTTTFTGSTLENDGLIVVDGRNLSSGSMTVSWSGSSITNNGKMYFNGLNSDSNSFTLDPSSSLINNGLMYFSQDSSSGYSGSVQLKSNSFTNDGTICLKNVKAYLESSISGNGCITIGENTVYAIQSDSEGTLGSQTLYMTSPSSMIYVDSYGVTNNIHVRGFGNGNYLTFGTSIVRHSYNSDTGVLYFSVFLFISHKINIGTGYDNDGFSMTTISNHIGSRLLNNALVYSGSDPNGKPSACMACDSSSWIPVISIPSSSSLPTLSSVFSSSSIISTLSTVNSSGFISSSSSANFSPYPSSSFSSSTTSTTAIVASFSTPSFFVSTVDISSSSDSRMSSLLSSSTSTTSSISPNKSTTSDLLTASLMSKATTSQDISSESSSFANNTTSINHSAVLPSSTSIRSSFISSSMSMDHTSTMESRAKTNSTTTPVSSIFSSHSTLTISSLFTSTAKTSHSQLQSSSIVSSISLSSIQSGAAILTSASSTLVLSSSNIYNTSSKTHISLSLTSSSFSLSSLTNDLVSSHKSKALSSTIKDSDKNFTFTSIDPMSRMHSSPIESPNKMSSTTTFSTTIKTSSLSSFMSDGHTAAPITKKDSSSVASSLPVFSSMSSQSRSTILFNSSSLWNKVSSDGMSTSSSSLAATSTSKETHSVEYSGASSTSMTSIFSSVLSSIKSSSKSESVAKIQSISASANNSNISKVNVISHYSTYDTIVMTTTTASCPYSELDMLSDTLVVLTTVVVENESKKESSFISLVHPSCMAHTTTLATLSESSYNNKSSTLSKAQIFNHSLVVLQSDNNGIILTETDQPKKKTTLAFTRPIESSQFRQKTQSIGTVHTTMTTTASTKTISLTDGITDVVRINTDSAPQKITSSKLIYTVSTYMLQENANSGYKSQMFNSLLSIIWTPVALTYEPISFFRECRISIPETLISNVKSTKLYFHKQLRLFKLNIILNIFIG